MKKDTLHARIEKALDKIRPYLIKDGGNVHVLEVTKNHDVIVEFVGNCRHCPISNTTFTIGVEQTIKSTIPEINEVKVVQYNE